MSELYSFCRIIDDIADEQPPEEAGPKLHRVKNDLLQRESDFEWVNEFLDLVDRDGAMVEAGYELVIGAETDIHRRIVTNWNELCIYCYRVAGVVGLMMCPLIGVREARAHPYAVDLGIAMQLTNICRDVGEDAQRQRCYLPETVLRDHGSNSGEIMNRSIKPEKLRAVLDDLMTRAESYYDSAFAGLYFIPARTRLSILMALYLYRGIGRKARAQGYPVLSERVYLTVTEKLMLGFWALCHFVGTQVWRKTPRIHVHELHQPIVGFPGADPDAQKVGFV